jgi:trehalose 6-phosphate synthase/phosphatase
MQRIINVSNRLPVTIGEDIQKSSGGLISAMEGVTGQDLALEWIGWPGGSIEVADRQRELTATLKKDFGFTPVFLTDEEIELYYDGYSNASLWPVLHYMPNIMAYESHWWDTYLAVNERFAEVVVETADDTDLIWIHDYHLMLLPMLLRQRNPSLRIGFFLHTPFPSYEVFRCHPQRTQLLQGLLGADLIGFHTFSYLRHFRSAVLRLLGVEAEMNHVPHEQWLTRIGVYPIGIHAAKFEKQIASPEHQAQLAEYRDVYKDKQIVLSVERADYTKGIIHRLAAIDRYLERCEDHSRISFLMISVPSRGDVPAYQDLRAEVEQLVGKINGRHATVDNVPVHFIFQSVTFTQLCALYSLADVLIATPLIDGMNLVAKEYIACKKEEDGVLILSEFAGAAQELFDAVIVNPYDVDAVADRLDEALRQPPQARKGHMQRMRTRVLRNDARRWAGSFISDLASHAQEEVGPIEGRAGVLEILATMRSCTKRLALFLAYDGTLREFEARADAAAPTPGIRDLLTRLSRIEHVDTFLISGRSQRDLERWFGDYPVTLLAEHGFCCRRVGESSFTELFPDLDLSWKEQVLPILRHHEDSTPGSLVEEKRSSVVWHYRRSDPEFGRWKAHQLAAELSEVASNLPVEVHHGKAIIEVTSIQVNKGQMMAKLLSEADYGLVLCAGDDQTDESMFACGLPNVISIKVGPGQTCAKYRVRSTSEFQQLISRIAEIFEQSSVSAQGGIPPAS